MKKSIHEYARQFAQKSTAKPPPVFDIDLVVIIGLAVLVGSDHIALMGKISLGFLCVVSVIGKILIRNKPFNDLDMIVIIICAVLGFMNWIHSLGQLALLTAVIVAAISKMRSQHDTFFDIDTLTVTGLILLICTDGLNPVIMLLLSCLVIVAVVYIFIRHRHATKKEREEKRKEAKFYCQVEALKRELSLKGPKK